MVSKTRLKKSEKQVGTRKPGLCTIMDDWEGIRCTWNTKAKRKTVVCAKTDKLPTEEGCDKCENQAIWVRIHRADGSG